MKQVNSKSAEGSIPEPSPKVPLFGHLFCLRQNSLEGFRNLTAKMGPIFRLNLGSNDIVTVTSLDLIKEVADESKFDHAHLGPIFGLIREMFISEKGKLNEAAVWRILMPGFSSKTQEACLPRMLDVLDKLFIKLDKSIGKEINLSDELTRAVLDAVGAFGFNFRFNAISSENGHPISKLVEQIISYIGMKIFLPKLIVQLLFFAKKKCDRNLSTLNKYSGEIIEERKKHPTEVPDLLNQMMKEVDKASGEKMTDADIRIQIGGLIAASIETTQGLLGFAFYALMTYPNVLEKAYAEVDSVLGTDFGKRPSLRDFQNLTYLNKILKECLRLWPPAPVVERSAREDTILAGKYPIKKRQWVWTIIPVIQRDRAIWGDDAELFNPDRFDHELVAKRDPLSFIPFGMGKGACLGRQFAMLQGLIILSLVLQRYRLHLRPGYEFDTVTTGGAIQPRTLWVTLEKRKHKVNAPPS